jgi:hypothetical protein
LHLDLSVVFSFRNSLSPVFYASSDCPSEQSIKQIEVNVSCQCPASLGVGVSCSFTLCLMFRLVLIEIKNVLVEIKKGSLVLYCVTLFRPVLRCRALACPVLRLSSNVTLDETL